MNNLLNAAGNALTNLANNIGSGIQEEDDEVDADDQIPDGNAIGVSGGVDTTPPDAADVESVGDQIPDGNAIGASGGVDTKPSDAADVESVGDQIPDTSVVAAKNEPVDVEGDELSESGEEEKNGEGPNSTYETLPTQPPQSIPPPPTRPPPNLLQNARPKPSPPPKPSFIPDSSAIVKMEPLDPNREMEPEEFFRDFKLYLERKLAQVDASSESGNAQMVAGLTESVKNMHVDLSNALGHLGTTLESDMMDLRYLTQPPDTNLFNIANKCEYHEIDPVAEANLESALEAQYGFNGAVSTKLRCDKGSSVWDRMKHERADIKYFVVTCCVFHHYHVENLSHVSVLSRTRLIVEDGDSDYLMFVYLLKRGL